MQYKIKVASISSDGDSVFIACGMPAGYGYAVWRLSPEFTNGESIVSGLSGCCGQMDVQANEKGIFVAENSRKRVRRFDAEGKSICDWGKSSEGIAGFGSCCNPMNLAFGTDGAVYTAEDTTGRIKRYSPDGKLLSVVGAADVVPGCKKVSIGVDTTGDRVYMLDITKNNIAVLTRVSPDPTEPLNEDEGSSLGGKLLQAIFGS
jgi:sugar lactone lactonase YvrE